jgi:hypothetical protein
MKKLFIGAHRYDFGHDWYASIINIRKWSLLQISLSWNDYPSWPCIQVRSGSGDVLSVLFWAHKFGFDFTLISRTWDWSRYDKFYETFEEAGVLDESERK